MTGTSNNPGKMPVLFIGHGSPMNAIEDNMFVRNWKKLGKSLPKPDAILCISAHWVTNGTFVTAMEEPETIHDFGGFPRALFEVQYPAPGSPELAVKVKSQIKSADVGLDQKWGLDHGAWSVIMHLYPEAHIPVIQLSLDYNQIPQSHYDLAKELTDIRKRNVLIIGSGNIVHNLEMVKWDKINNIGYSYDWAREAKEKMTDFILKGDHQPLIHYKSQGRPFTLSIPTPEHFLPLLYILALRENNEKITIYNDEIVGGSIAMTSVVIGNDLSLP